MSLSAVLASRKLQRDIFIAVGETVFSRWHTSEHGAYNPNPWLPINAPQGRWIFPTFRINSPELYFFGPWHPRNPWLRGEDFIASGNVVVDPLALAELVLYGQTQIDRQEGMSFSKSLQRVKNGYSELQRYNAHTGQFEQVFDQSLDWQPKDRLREFRRKYFFGF
jgi:hypothetical protein